MLHSVVAYICHNYRALASAPTLTFRRPRCFVRRFCAPSRCRRISPDPRDHEPVVQTLYDQLLDRDHRLSPPVDNATPLTLHSFTDKSMHCRLRWLHAYVWCMAVAYLHSLSVTCAGQTEQRIRAGAHDITEATTTVCVSGILVNKRWLSILPARAD